MKCALCDRNSYLGLNLFSGKHVCFECVTELKKFQYYAPMPNQEQPGNYFPQIGVTSGANN
jgi:hypothetical protein